MERIERHFGCAWDASTFIICNIMGKSPKSFYDFLGDVIDYGHETLEVADEVYRLVMQGRSRPYFRKS